MNVIDERNAASLLVGLADLSHNGEADLTDVERGDLETVQDLITRYLDTPDKPSPARAILTSVRSLAHLVNDLRMNIGQKSDLDDRLTTIANAIDELEKLSADQVVLPDVSPTICYGR